MWGQARLKTMGRGGVGHSGARAGWWRGQSGMELVEGRALDLTDTDDAHDIARSVAAAVRATESAHADQLAPYGRSDGSVISLCFAYAGRTQSSASYANAPFFLALAPHPHPFLPTSQVCPSLAPLLPRSSPPPLPSPSRPRSSEPRGGVKEDFDALLVFGEERELEVGRLHPPQRLPHQRACR